eukprot:9011272-Alexandrium_andersonii.AAC.1
MVTSVGVEIRPTQAPETPRSGVPSCCVPHAPPRAAHQGASDIVYPARCDMVPKSSLTHLFRRSAMQNDIVW